MHALRSRTLRHPLPPQVQRPAGFARGKTRVQDWRASLIELRERRQSILHEIDVLEKMALSISERIKDMLVSDGDTDEGDTD